MSRDDELWTPSGPGRPSKGEKVAQAAYRLAYEDGGVTWVYSHDIGSESGYSPLQVGQILRRLDRYGPVSAKAVDREQFDHRKGLTWEIRVED